MKTTDKIETVYFSTKGQVVIPRRLRQELEIEEGTKAIVYRGIRPHCLETNYALTYQSPARLSERHRGDEDLYRRT